MYYAKSNLTPYIRNRVTVNFFLLYNVVTPTVFPLLSKFCQLKSYILSSKNLYFPS